MGEVITIGEPFVHFLLPTSTHLATVRQVSFTSTRLLSSLIVCRIFPEWKVYSEFINEHLSRALDLDAKLSSHPIEVECPDANKVNQVCLSLPMDIQGNFDCRIQDFRCIIILKGWLRSVLESN
jgi:hypothetical protein